MFKFILILTGRRKGNFSVPESPGRERMKIEKSSQAKINTKFSNQNTVGRAD